MNMEGFQRNTNDSSAFSNVFNLMIDEIANSTAKWKKKTMHCAGEGIGEKGQSQRESHWGVIWNILWSKIMLYKWLIMEPLQRQKIGCN